VAGYIYDTPTAKQLQNVGGAQEDSDCLVAPEWEQLFYLRQGRRDAEDAVTDAELGSNAGPGGNGVLVDIRRINGPDCGGAHKIAHLHSETIPAVRIAMSLPSPSPWRCKPRAWRSPTDCPQRRTFQTAAGDGESADFARSEPKSSCVSCVSCPIHHQSSPPLPSGARQTLPAASECGDGPVRHFPHGRELLGDLALSVAADARESDSSDAAERDHHVHGVAAEPVGRDLHHVHRDVRDHLVHSDVRDHLVHLVDVEEQGVNMVTTASTTFMFTTAITMYMFTPATTIMYTPTLSTRNTIRVAGEWVEGE